MSRPICGGFPRQSAGLTAKNCLPPMFLKTTSGADGNDGLDTSRVDSGSQASMVLRATSP